MSQEIGKAYDGKEQKRNQAFFIQEIGKKENTQSREKKHPCIIPGILGKVNMNPRQSNEQGAEKPNPPVIKDRLTGMVNSHNPKNAEQSGSETQPEFRMADEKKTSHQHEIQDMGSTPEFIWNPGVFIRNDLVEPHTSLAEPVEPEKGAHQNNRKEKIRETGGAFLLFDTMHRYF